MRLVDRQHVFDESVARECTKKYKIHNNKTQTAYRCTISLKKIKNNKQVLINFNLGTYITTKVIKSIYL